MLFLVWEIRTLPSHGQMQRETRLQSHQMMNLWKQLQITLAGRISSCCESMWVSAVGQILAPTTLSLVISKELFMKVLHVMVVRALSEDSAIVVLVAKILTCVVPVK